MQSHLIILYTHITSDFCQAYCEAYPEVADSLRDESHRAEYMRRWRSICTDGDEEGSSPAVDRGYVRIADTQGEWRSRLQTMWLTFHADMPEDAQVPEDAEVSDGCSAPARCSPLILVLCLVL